MTENKIEKDTSSEKCIPCSFFYHVQRFFESRWSGCILGPTYGFLFYLYITYMILNGSPFTDPKGLCQNDVTNHTDGDTINVRPNAKNDIAIESRGNIVKRITNSTKIDSCFTVHFKGKEQGRTRNKTEELTEEYKLKCRPLMSVQTR